MSPNQQVAVSLCIRQESDRRNVFFFCFQCNGMSNRFWGWGREDDEFYRRLRKVQLQVKGHTTAEVRLMFRGSALFLFAALQTERNHHRIQNIPPHPRPSLEEEGPEEGRIPETGTEVCSAGLHVPQNV